MEQPTIFQGNSNLPLAKKISEHLGIAASTATVECFSDGEISVEVSQNVRGGDVFVVQSLCSPVNDNLMELLLLIDTLHRASAERITAVIPYLGYSRQDRKPRSARVPISARVVADMITSASTSRLLTMDLHADQIQGFYNIPVDNIYATPIMLGDVWKQDYDEITVVSPDIGGVVRARAVSKQLSQSEFAIIDKRRPRANEAKVMNIIGEVKGRTCLIVDDIVDTANTLCKAAAALKEAGAKRVVSYATHPVLSGSAIKNIHASELDELVVTDTIPLTTEAEAEPKIRQLSISKLLAEAISRINRKESISSLFME